MVNNLNSLILGERFQTYNCHSLLHLADDVKQLGPLWTHSCFPFEDFNGDLKDLFHGTQNIPGQVISCSTEVQGFLMEILQVGS